MTIQLAYIDSGKTLALTPGRGARIRVLDGLVWITTGGSLDDVWLRAGQEHRVPSRGLTVIESAVRSCVALVPATTALWPSLRRLPLRRWLDLSQVFRGAASVARALTPRTATASQGPARAVRTLRTTQERCWCEAAEAGAARPDMRRWTVNRNETSLRHVLFGIAAVAMTAIVFGVLVVIPATIKVDSWAEVHAASKASATAPIDVVASDPRGTAASPHATRQNLSSARSATRVR